MTKPYDDLHADGFLDDEFARFREQRLEQLRRGKRGTSRRPAEAKVAETRSSMDDFERYRTERLAAKKKKRETKEAAPPPKEESGDAFFGTSTYERSRMRANLSDERSQRTMTEEEREQVRRTERHRRQIDLISGAVAQPLSEDDADAGRAAS